MNDYKDLKDHARKLQESLDGKIPEPFAVGHTKKKGIDTLVVYVDESNEVSGGVFPKTFEGVNVMLKPIKWPLPLDKT